MTKLYTKGSTVVDEILAGAERYQVKDNAGTVVYSSAQIDLSTGVTQAGTVINAARINNIENGIDAIDTLLSDYLAGGWQNGFAMTYVDAKTFTVAGDLTAIFIKGTRLKFTQTTVKYATVVSSSFGAGVTTVTIIVNTDYTIANAAITLPYYSYLENPAGWPDVFNFATTVTSGTGTITTSAVLLARYSVGKRKFFYEVAIGITTVGSGAGDLIFTLPPNISAFADGVSVGEGREYQSTGTPVQARYVGPSSVKVLKLDNTTILASGRSVFVSGMFVW